MDIQIKQNCVPVWRDLACLTKSAQISMESVVPDTKDDIGRILSVRPELLLKSRDLNEKSAAVGGLLLLNILYIDDSGSRVAHYRAEESFHIDFDLPMADDFCVLQSRFLLSALKARIINPRKIGIDCEILCLLNVSRADELCIEQSMLLSPDQPIVHVNECDTELNALVSVAEKTFSVNEQLSLTPDAPQLKEIAAAELRYHIDSKESLGSRLLVKGSAELLIVLETADSGVPFIVPYHLPFSQMVDLGETESDDAELWIETSSIWLELMETLDDRHMIDLELHALLQVRARKQISFHYLSDAYCNQMPCSCVFDTLTLPDRFSERCIEWTAEEKLEITDKFQDLLQVFATVLRPDTDQRSLALDLLYRDQDNKLVPLRRMISLCMPDGSTIPADAALTCREIRHRKEDNKLILSITVTMRVNDQTQKQIRYVSSLNLDESQAFDCSVFPSLTAVWAETESIWELAKIYHSSPEAIREMNGPQDGNPVFIPKTK